MHLQLRFIFSNQVEKMPQCVRWPMNHLQSHKNNYIFIYFGMPLKMDDINVFLILFSSKSTLVASISCICNYKPFCNRLYDYKLLLPSAMEDSRKNCWFRHKSQMHGLEWTKLLVMCFDVCGCCKDFGVGARTVEIGDKKWNIEKLSINFPNFVMKEKAWGHRGVVLSVLIFLAFTWEECLGVKRICSCINLFSFRHVEDAMQGRWI